MFSKGNASERHRIGNLNCQNEVILDLYAGIGYFTLPFLIGGKAKIVHACEWNPSSIIALKYVLFLLLKILPGAYLSLVSTWVATTGSRAEYAIVSSSILYQLFFLLISIY